MNRNARARGNLFFVDADIFKTNRIALAASWTDTTAGFGDHAVTIYNPFALTAAEALFRRPVAFGAIDSAGNVLDDKVFDVRLDIKLFGKNPISVRWFSEVMWLVSVDLATPSPLAIVASNWQINSPWISFRQQVSEAWWDQAAICRYRRQLPVSKR
jgi:hypothetical protein